MPILRRRGRAELPEDWEHLVERHVRAWRTLDEHEREVFAADLAAFLTSRRWEAARGFRLDDRIRVVVSAQAALLVLGLGLDALADVDTIVVHPTTMRFDRAEEGPAPGTETYGPVHLIGEANERGPLVLAWDAASSAARHPRRGQDVVLHELAHKLDMADGVVDGTPPIDERELAERWVEVCTDTFELLVDEGDDLIDDYAATDAGEFFAVVTELFFTLPRELRDDHPELYGVFRAYYGQDPAARAERGPGR